MPMAQSLFNELPYNPEQINIHRIKCFIGEERFSLSMGWESEQSQHSTTHNPIGLGLHRLYQNSTISRELG
jgi:hypothetical protein